MNLRKLTLPLSLVSIIATNALPAADAMLTGEKFAVDTVCHYKTAPGTTYTNMKFSAMSQWFTAHVVTFDLDKAEHMEFKVETGRDTCNSTERITAIAKRKTTGEHRPIAAINGDFFITSSFANNHVLGKKILGFPNNVNITGGKIISPDAIDAGSVINALVMTENGDMWIDTPEMSYDFIGPNKKSYVKIYHANYPRLEKEIVLYNSFYGKSTRTDAGGCEVALELAPGEKWGVNRDILMKVVKEPSSDGNMAIPVNGAVISADAGRTAQIDYIKKNLKLGDEVKVRVKLQLPGYDNMQPEGITEVIGGDVKILRDGTAVTSAAPDRFINSCNSPYSRSMIGYSSDRKKLVICVTDRGASGKLSTVGYGTSYPQGGDLMKYLGCHEALNFDGGGSTLLWTADKQIVNVPRDGSERAVGNGFFAYVNAPADNDIAEIRFADHAKTVDKAAKYSPVIYGYNRYGELIDKNVSGFTLSCPAALGTVSGTTLTASGAGCHALKATYNGLIATIPVSIAGTVAGIEETDADSATATEYFNLHGVKVDDPAAGVYIARKGQMVEKVMIK